MSDKPGRNDPCPCGSGKKYKQCCLGSQAAPGKRKLTAKWLNPRQEPDLMNQAFGDAIESANKPFKPVKAAQETD